MKISHRKRFHAENYRAFWAREEIPRVFPEKRQKENVGGECNIAWSENKVRLGCSKALKE
jgi:hypothetical protein